MQIEPIIQKFHFWTYSQRIKNCVSKSTLCSAGELSGGHLHNNQEMQTAGILLDKWVNKMY